MALNLELPTHKDKEFMDSTHTCDGDDSSPSISWNGVPDGTKSLILLLEDPDAPLGTFFHWSIYNIRPEETGLADKIPKSETTQEGHAQGVNGMRRIGYMGPCPPGKKPHHYVFTLFATTIEPDLDPGLKKKDLTRLLEKHTIEKAVTTIKYLRARNR